MKKLNKKLCISLIIAVIAIALIILVIAITKPSYKKQIKELVNSLLSEDSMEKYMNKYADYKAIYAFDEISHDDSLNISDDDAIEKAFNEAYKNAPELDYDSVKTNDVLGRLQFRYTLQSLENVEVKVKNIGKAEDYDKLPFFKKVDFTLEVTYDGNTEEMDLSAIFYNRKFVYLINN